MKLIEDILAIYSPAQIRMLAFCSAHAGQVVQHGTIKEWRHQRYGFPHLWEKLSHSKTLIKEGSPISCSLPQWELLNKHMPRATAAWPIYFYLADIYSRESEGFLITQSDIREALGTSNASTTKAIRMLHPNLVSGFFPNGQPMMIAMVNVGDENLWKQRYNVRRYMKTYVQSPQGELLSISHGEQKFFAKKHNLSQTSVSRIVRGKSVSGWKMVKPYSISSVD